MQPPSKLLETEMAARNRNESMIDVRLVTMARPSRADPSEVNFQRQLDLPPRVPSIRYLAELRGPERHARVTEAWMIQRIECFTAQLKVAGFFEAKPFIN